MRADVAREIQRRLRKWRMATIKQEALTKTQFAAKAQVGVSTIQDWFNAEPNEFNPSLEQLSSFLAACNKNLGDLFDFLAARVDDDTRNLILRAHEHPLTKIQLKALLDMVKEADKLL